MIQVTILAEFSVNLSVPKHSENPRFFTLSKFFHANKIGYSIFDKCYILLMLKLPKLLTFKCEKDFRFHLLNCNQGFIVKEKIYENWNIGSDVYQNAKSPAKAKKYTI